MLERLKDWKTTVPALIIGALIIGAMLYAMRSRPEWGLPELVAFGGGVATIITGALTKSAQPASEKPAPPTVPPLPLLLALGGLVLAVALTGCTPAAQSTAARVGGGALAAVDGPACELVEVRSGSALAGVVCEMAAGALERYLASAGSTSQALTSSEARPPAARCRLVPVRAGGAHVGFVCAEHEGALVAALARDGGA